MTRLQQLVVFGSSALLLILGIVASQLPGPGRARCCIQSLRGEVWAAIERWVDEVVAPAAVVP